MHPEMCPVLEMINRRALATTRTKTLGSVAHTHKQELFFNQLVIDNGSHMNFVPEKPLCIEQRPSDNKNECAVTLETVSKETQPKWRNSCGT